MNRILIIPFIVFLIHCKPPNYNNPNDPNSSKFLESQVLGCFTTGSVLCKPFHVKGIVSGLTQGNTLKIQYEYGGPSDSIVANGQFDIITRGGLFPKVFIAKQPDSLHCIITSSGLQQGEDVVGMEITCPIFKSFVQNQLVGYSRCGFGQEWNTFSGGTYVGDCTATGTAANQFGLSLNLNFCNITPTNGCTSGLAGGILASPPWIGAADSDIYNSCNQYNNTNKWNLNKWRVPSKNELKQIVICSNGPTIPLDDFVACAAGNSAPVLNTQVFPNFTGSNILWSSNSYPIDSIQAHALELSNGRVYVFDQDGSNQVLCVTDL
ncbi:DUF1566 domain-containing protein [Leptospira meyeri]|uniref:Lcl C-terminal domain-containing protein n=1 Tax=Leptospira meyeri TaxID=29508 RepID=UPI001083B57D|nr:DUF1566 domain-containing protein [Leptospira meyeri]TGM64654.1 DUF1566 domain-containing protein [Leptospira meyeri]TGM66879.1 DUF1566 domain-containing protein [Leptospira meyeri]